MPEYNEAWCFAEITEKWDKLLDLRDDVMKALEIARAEKLIGKSLDAKVTVYTKDEEVYALLNSFAEELATVYIVSEAELVLGDAPEGAISEEGSAISVLVEVAGGEKCDRCWIRSKECTPDGEGYLCPRCRAIVG
jgi:isoleucyl-tRNA synthetase